MCTWKISGYLLTHYLIVLSTPAQDILCTFSGEGRIQEFLKGPIVNIFGGPSEAENVIILKRSILGQNRGGESLIPFSGTLILFW